jgi:hypothetical protein
MPGLPFAAKEDKPAAAIGEGASLLEQAGGEDG